MYDGDRQHTFEAIVSKHTNIIIRFMYTELVSYAANANNYTHSCKHILEYIHIDI